MKTITIRKSLDFSAKSKVLLHIGEKQIYIKGFGSFSAQLKQDEEFYASHLWTRSKKIQYEEVKGSSFLIKPRMDKLFAFIILMICIICMAFFILTHYRWSLLPLIPIIIYVFLYLSILKDRYLIIKPIKEEPEIEESTHS